MRKLDVEEFVQLAEKIYATKLKPLLEPDYVDEFVAIEPISGDYFLGKTLNEATRVARQSYPDRWTHAMRVGHRTALHLGMEFR